MVNNNSQPNLNQFQKTSNELVYAFLPLISDPGKLIHSCKLLFISQLPNLT